MSLSMASIEAKKKMTHARTNLLLEHHFFGELAMMLELREDPSCDTAWTDGKSLGYSADYVSKLSLQQCIGLFAHEVMHNAMLHPYRQELREHERWNLAADFAIDPILVDAHFDVPDATVNPAWANKSAEWIYSQLPPSPKGGGGAAGDGSGKGKQSGKDGKSKKPGGCGEVRQAPSDAQTESEWKTAVQQAAAAARAAGKLPASLEALVEEIVKPTLSWREIMRRWFQDRAAADYNWSVPNRRYLAEDIYLPSVRSEAMPPVVFGQDVSGSVGDNEHSAGCAELQSCLDEVQPEVTVVIQCDSIVQHVEEVERGNDLEPPKRYGHGGTSFKPVFDYVEKHDIQPACMVFITDLFPNDGWPKEPDYPVLWLSVTKGAVAPWGETLYIEDGGVSR